MYALRIHALAYGVEATGGVNRTELTGAISLWCHIPIPCMYYCVYELQYTVYICIIPYTLYIYMCYTLYRVEATGVACAGGVWLSL